MKPNAFIKLVAIACFLTSGFVEAANARKPSSSQKATFFMEGSPNAYEILAVQTVSDMVPNTNPGPFLVLDGGTQRCAISADVAKSAGFSLGEIAIISTMRGVDITCKDTNQNTSVAKGIIISIRN